MGKDRPMRAGTLTATKGAAGKAARAVALAVAAIWDAPTPPVGRVGRNRSPVSPDDRLRLRRVENPRFDAGSPTPWSERGQAAPGWPFSHPWPNRRDNANPQLQARRRAKAPMFEFDLTGSGRSRMPVAAGSRPIKNACWRSTCRPNRPSTAIVVVVAC